MTHHQTGRLCLAIAVAGAVSALTYSAAGAATINVDNSNVDSISGIATALTTGANMAGMTVTLNFAGGGSDTAVWATTGASSGAAGPAILWEVSQTGDTYNNLSWTANFGNNLVTSMVISGTPGLTVFDIDSSGTGTAGSVLGKPFASNHSEDASFVVTYSDVVQIGAAAPVGDLYHTMTVDFTGTSFGSVVGLFNFSQDTDNDIAIESVPEAATLGLFGLGLVGLGFASRRRRTA